MLPSSLILLLLMVGAGVGLVAGLGLKLKRLTSNSCSTLIEGMCYIDMERICQLARYRDNGSAEAQVRPSELIDKLGGAEGLRRLDHNAAGMIDIARYLTLMRPEARDLAQSVRSEGTRVRRIVMMLRWQSRLGVLDSRVGQAVQVLARSYVLVSTHTLLLYLQIGDEMDVVLRGGMNLQTLLKPEVTASLP